MQVDIKPVFEIRDESPCRMFPIPMEVVKKKKKNRVFALVFYAACVAGAIQSDRETNRYAADLKIHLNNRGTDRPTGFCPT